MKLEVINSSTEKTIETYSVPDLSMFVFFNFEEWKDEGTIVIDLSSLSDTMVNPNIEDSEIQESEPSREAVDFYLPDPLKDSMLFLFAKSQTETKETPSQFADRLNEISEQALRPMLKLSTILSAVVTEILQNHHPHSEHKVRISDG